MQFRRLTPAGDSDFYNHCIHLASLCLLLVSGHHDEGQLRRRLVSAQCGISRATAKGPDRKRRADDSRRPRVHNSRPAFPVAIGDKSAPPAGQSHVHSDRTPRLGLTAAVSLSPLLSQS
ncbi:hypothetical protein JG687_00000959 [Phytophthora cactorum]|uniref:Uncharacterized protein n=1 Tax=Phytophthora cactorum TaxID=29920 RepID=A0A8T1V3I1_9STRA|nr:hypothetical protein JG687_00000959 [Phytophthora cactorum]